MRLGKMWKVPMVVGLISMLLFTWIPVVEGSGENEREWTVMVYIDRDNDLGYNEWGEEYTVYTDPIVQEIISVRSSENMQIMILWDGLKIYDSGFYSVAQNGTLEKYQLRSNEELYENYEFNMGHPGTLYNFMNWTIDKYPAEHTCLIMMGHGEGWMGSMVDWTDSDFLTTRELGYALEAFNEKIGRKIDVLVFDACLMANLEVVYEVRDYVDYFCGSEELEFEGYEDGEFVKSFNYAEPLNGLKDNPSKTPKELAISFVENYKPSFHTRMILIVRHSQPSTPARSMS
jgi:hypothetical protein